MAPIVFKPNTLKNFCHAYAIDQITRMFVQLFIGTPPV